MGMVTVISKFKYRFIPVDFLYLWQSEGGVYLDRYGTVTSNFKAKHFSPLIFLISDNQRGGRFNLIGTVLLLQNLKRNIYRRWFFKSLTIRGWEGEFNCIVALLFFKNFKRNIYHHQFINYDKISQKNGKKLCTRVTSQNRSDFWKSYWSIGVASLK